MELLKGTIYAIDTWTMRNPRTLANRLNRDGLVIFRGQDPREVLAAFDKIAERQQHPDDETGGVTRLRPRDEVAGQPGYDGFSRKSMPPHTDGSAADQPAELVGIVCIRPADSGGAVSLADGAAIVQELSRTSPEAACALALPRTATFGRERRAFRVLDEQDERTFIRYRQDGLGDYSAVHLAAEKFDEFVQANVITLSLQEGDGYILQNGRWLHGRGAFTGEREMLRLLGRSRRIGSRPIVRFGFDRGVASQPEVSGKHRRLAG